MQIILASASPRRKELLEQIGVEFTICPAKGEEKITKAVPGDVVEELARQKAEEVAAGILAYNEEHPELVTPQDCLVYEPASRNHLMLHDFCLHRIHKSCQGQSPDGVCPWTFIVVGADTVVAYGGAILGKPKDEADAARMLRMLSGNTHHVYTGVALVFVDASGRVGERIFHDETEVTMYPMSDKEIADYVATGEPMDKAGAYGIQGRCAIHIAKISGDYNNVVGLPVARLYQELKSIGVCLNGE
ncbi:MAG: Maf family protein [Clostridiales bacterium]|nr:Maf family protein [Clostridiales bacterium]